MTTTYDCTRNSGRRTARRAQATADPAERHQIEAELQLAHAELAAAIAEQDGGTIDAAPPF
jgi:hypothetical protein